MVTSTLYVIFLFGHLLFFPIRNFKNDLPQVERHYEKMWHLNLATKYVRQYRGIFFKFMELSTQIYIDIAQKIWKLRNHKEFLDAIQCIKFLTNTHTHTHTHTHAHMYLLYINIIYLSIYLSVYLYLSISSLFLIYQFLHYTSSHSDHTKRSIVFSQVLRVTRICSKKSDLLKHLQSGGFLRILLNLRWKKSSLHQKIGILREASHWKQFLLLWHIALNLSQWKKLFLKI